MTPFIESIDRLFAALKAKGKTKELADNLGVSTQYVTKVFRTIIQTGKRAEALTDKEKKIINAAKDICSQELEQARQFEDNLLKVTQ